MHKSPIAALVMFAALPLSAVAAESYTIDPPHTFPHFSINHLGFSTMQGRFDRTSGTVTLDRAAKTGSVDISIEAGNLTILGVTKPVTLSIDAFNCGTNPMSKKDECGAAASAQIKRSDFGVKYALPAVGDDVKLVFEIEAIKN
jgi:polyisoprenoid-binding protein YceI